MHLHYRNTWVRSSKSVAAAPAKAMRYQMCVLFVCPIVLRTLAMNCRQAGGPPHAKKRVSTLLKQQAVSQ